MRLCLSGRIVEHLQPRPALEDFLRVASEAGYDSVGLRAWQLPTGRTEGEAEAWAGAIRASGLHVCSLTLDACNAETIGLARRVTAKVLQVDGTPETLSRHARMLDDRMRIGPQMHSGGAYESVGIARQTLAKATDPKVGVVVEPANLMFAGTVWTRDTFLPLRGRIIGCNLQSVLAGEGDAEVRMADGRRVKYRRVALGANTQIRLRGFLDALTAAGYDDFINVIEPACAELQPIDLARRTLSALREMNA